MNAARDRKEAARILGVTMQAQLRALTEAQGDAEIQTAAIILGDTFNRNSAFICWVLKEYGGVQQMPFPRPPAPRQNVVNIDGTVPQLPGFLTDPKKVH